MIFIVFEMDLLKFRHTSQARKGVRNPERCSIPKTPQVNEFSSTRETPHKTINININK